jgi:acyl-CoA oxidase
LAEAIGHRLAVEAARKAGIDSKIIDLYISGVTKEYSAWYAEKGGFSRAVQRELESRAADALLPQLEDIMRNSGMQAYSHAPMASRGVWDEFVAGLETFEGNASPQLIARLWM